MARSARDRPAGQQQVEDGVDHLIEPEVRQLRQLQLSSDEEHLDRLLADTDLNTRLGLAGHAGAEWDRFREILASYGVGS